MQKLVTVCLSGESGRHGDVEEHLASYLSDGWRIATVCAAGGGGGAWVAVVLERGEPAAGQVPGVAQAQLHPFAPLLEFPQSPEGRPIEPSEVPVGPDTPLEPGSRVLAYSQGRWWRAVVVALEADDLVRIHFPGWDPKWDTTVPREELQVDLHPPEE